MLVGLAFWSLIGPLRAQSQLVVVAGFDRPPDTSTLKGLEQEVAELFSNVGMTISWQPPTQNNVRNGTNLIVSVKFLGNCRLEPGALSLPRNGALAWIQSQGSAIQPSIQVDCDRAAAMVWQNRGSLPLSLVTRAFGLALGRIVAHELYHYLTQSSAHTTSELFRNQMSSRDLMLPRVRFQMSEIEALRNGISRLQSTVQAVVRIPCWKKQCLKPI